MYESRESSESRGFSHPSYFGFILSSESRDCGESHVTSYGSYGGTSESRSSESRTTPVVKSYSTVSESRVPSESCFPVLNSQISSTSKVKTGRKVEDANVPEKYNSFEDIDTLIEKLELTLPILEGLQSRGKQYSQSLKRRQAQIEKLRQIKEERIISEIEQESDTFDEQIEEVKKLTKKPTQPPIYSSYDYDWDGSESHDGESRW